jgi:hypothetical protein
VVRRDLSIPHMRETLNPARQDQDKQDNHDDAEAAERIIAPTRAVRPGGKCSQQKNY